VCFWCQAVAKHHELDRLRKAINRLTFRLFPTLKDTRQNTTRQCRRRELYDGAVNYMAQVNISEAATLASVARSTVQTHIKQGKLSVTVLGNGQKTLDTSELERVYGPITTSTVVERDSNISQQTTSQIGHIAQEDGRLIQVLQAQVADLQRQLEVRERETQTLHGLLEQKQLTSESSYPRWQFWRK